MSERFLKSFASKFGNRIFASSVYSWILSRSPVPAVTTLPASFPGNALRGQSLQLPELMDTVHQNCGPAAAGRTDGDRFGWLADLQASGLEASARISRDVLDAWIAGHDHWDPILWQPGLLADRLCAWIAAAGFLLNGADQLFNRRFKRALARQSRHLIWTTRAGAAVPYGFAVQKAFIICGIALSGHDKNVKHGLDLLKRSSACEVLADGGHCSRNPSIHLNALRHLIEIRNAMELTPSGPPVWLQGLIDKMTPVLRTFQMGDGNLARFNGAVFADAEAIEATLSGSKIKVRAATNCPHSGFQRLAARRTAIVMDTGVVNRAGGSVRESAGTHSFEMTVGKQRLVVNCGAATDDNAALNTALRGTSAHSTLEVEATNSSEITKTGDLGKRRAWRIQELRREVDKNILVEATHDGYQPRFGLTHKRALYLSADGDQLRGEDTLRGDSPHTGVIRFHLHPSVHASLIEAGDSVLLKFGKSAGWRFRTSAAEIALEQSLYYDSLQRRQCQQIVVKIRHQAGDTIVKWRISREN